MALRQERGGSDNRKGESASAYRALPDEERQPPGVAYGDSMRSVGVRAKGHVRTPLFFGRSVDSPDGKDGCVSSGASGTFARLGVSSLVNGGSRQRMARAQMSAAGRLLPDDSAGFN